MKINIKEKENKEVGIGSIIEFDNGIIALVCNGNGFKYKTKEGYGLILLKHSRGDDWFDVADGVISYFDEGEYKVLATTDNWEINIK